MPPPLTISSSATSPHRGDGRRPPLGQLGRRAPLHEADRRAAQPPPRRPVADPGDLPLVGHQRDQSICGRRSISRASASACSARVHRRALRPDLHPPARRPPARVEVDADPDRRRPAPSTDSITSRCSAQSTVTIGAPAGLATERSASSSSAPRVGRRVGEQQVLEALLGQPQRLRQGEGHQPGEALVRDPGSPPAAPGSAPSCSRPGSACPPARPSISAALSHIASRSTKANGASTSAKISS